MTGQVSTSSKRPTRVLFMAWGPSVHARRRIQVFVDDPSFDVAVVSTYDYNFNNTQNILLKEAIREKEVSNCSISKSELRVIQRILNNIKQRLKKFIILIKTFFNGIKVMLSSDLFSELKLRIINIKLLKLFLLSSEFRSEIIKSLINIEILGSAIRKYNPDVVFLQTLLYPCYLAYFLPISIPLIITFWNGDVIWEAKWSGIEHSLKKAIVRYGVQRSRAITVNSQTAFNACLDYYSAQPEKIHLIRYPGVDLKRFKQISKVESRKKLGITFEKVVLSPRGLGGYLNSDIIVESASSVLRKYPNTLFLFTSDVGGQAELIKHQQRVDELSIGQNFRWDGQVPWDEMVRYYGSCDAMVSISSNDSLPNCMQEAMACGVPVIMGDIPQIREWMGNGAEEFLVPPRDHAALSDCILKVFEDPDGLIQSFVSKNIKLVKHVFDSEKNIKEVKKLVKEIARNQINNGESKYI